jgi:toxin ParE1/3/4
MLAIWDFGFDTWGLDQADNYHNQILSTIEFLAEHPQAGTDRSSLVPDYRSFGVGSHIVFYVQDGSTLTVIRVLHKGNDFERHL